MKRISQFLIMSAFTLNVFAQSPLSHISIRQQKLCSESTEEEQMEWQRIVYRELDLQDESNTCLYSLTNDEGLFPLVFQLAVSHTIPIYKHSINGKLVFDGKHQADILDVLRNHHIFFEQKDNKIVIDWDDIPSSEVLRYYIKESSFYDKANSSFSTKVLAICPVLVEESEFAETQTKYPLFWVEYKDLEPYLYNNTVSPDENNLALKMPLADYFSLNFYKGTIYNSNAIGKSASQASVMDSLFNIKRQKIEEGLVKVKRPIYKTREMSMKQKKSVPKKKHSRSWLFRRKSVK